jgi:heat shock protein HtpX
MNRLKTMFLIAALTALLLFVGQALGGRSGMTVALVFAVAMNFGAYWFSDKIVLRMYGAKEALESEAPELHSIVRDLAERMRIPMPKVYVIPEISPNAFATGRNPQNAAVAATAMIIAPLAAGLIQMAISRSREFMADETGAQLTGNPLGLASALKKIESWKGRAPMTQGSPATAHLFIINPFSARGMAHLFSTHPSTEERVKRLEAMTQQNRLVNVL